MAEHSPSMGKTLASIPSTTEKEEQVLYFWTLDAFSINFLLHMYRLSVVAQSPLSQNSEVESDLVYFLSS